MAQQRGRVIVISSVNEDLIVEAVRAPGPGETVLADGMAWHHGGKGGNQATAAARVGADVFFVGAVGDDSAGESALNGLTAEGVDVSYTSVVPGMLTGRALVQVTADGENRISVVAGANASIDTARVVAALEELRVRQGDVCLLCFEIPVEAVAQIALACVARGATTIVNPSPVASLPAALQQSGVLLIVNETEAQQLTEERRLDRSASMLRIWTGAPVIATAGGDGALLVTDGGAQRFAASRVDAIDTAGAGDTFAGVFAAAIATRHPLPSAVELAVDAAGQAVQSRGARIGMPRASLARP